MVSFGYFLSCEEFGPRELVRQAKLAEQVGFSALWISDHYHPWNDEQGQSPFVWSVIGALSEATRLPVTTAVTCPTVRTHPAVIAQVAATAAVQHEGRFVLGAGSGEARGERILSDHWPPADERLEMLEEAIEVIRALHGGDEVTYRGEHHVVENARIYTLPEELVRIYISGLGRKAARLAGRVGDGFVCARRRMPIWSRSIGRRVAGTDPAQAGFKVCQARTAEDGKATVYRIWPNAALPGELSQVLPTPRHFEQASQLVTPDMLPMPCGSGAVRVRRPVLCGGLLRRGLHQPDRPGAGRLLPVLGKEIAPAVAQPIGV